MGVVAAVHKSTSMCMCNLDSFSFTFHTFHLGSVQPLQDVALHQSLPLFNASWFAWKSDGTCISHQDHLHSLSLSQSNHQEGRVKTNPACSGIWYENRFLSACIHNDYNLNLNRGHKDTKPWHMQIDLVGGVTGSVYNYIRVEYHS